MTTPIIDVRTDPVRITPEEQRSVVVNAVLPGDNVVVVSLNGRYHAVPATRTSFSLTPQEALTMANALLQATGAILRSRGIR